MVANEIHLLIIRKLIEYIPLNRIEMRALYFMLFVWVMLIALVIQAACSRMLFGRISKQMHSC